MTQQNLFKKTFLSKDAVKTTLLLTSKYEDDDFKQFWTNSFSHLYSMLNNEREMTLEMYEGALYGTDLFIHESLDVSDVYSNVYKKIHSNFDKVILRVIKHLILESLTRFISNGTLIYDVECTQVEKELIIMLFYIKLNFKNFEKVLKVISSYTLEKGLVLEMSGDSLYKSIRIHIKPGVVSFLSFMQIIISIFDKKYIQANSIGVFSYNIEGIINLLMSLRILKSVNFLDLKYLHGLFVTLKWNFNIINKLANFKINPKGVSYNDLIKDFLKIRKDSNFQSLSDFMKLFEPEFTIKNLVLLLDPIMYDDDDFLLGQDKCFGMIINEILFNKTITNLDIVNVLPYIFSSNPSSIILVRSYRVPYLLRGNIIIPTQMFEDLLLSKESPIYLLEKLDGYEDRLGYKFIDNNGVMKVYVCTEPYINHEISKNVFLDVVDFLKSLFPFSSRESYVILNYMSFRNMLVDDFFATNIIHYMFCTKEVMDVLLQKSNGEIGSLLGIRKNDLKKKLKDNKINLFLIVGELYDTIFHNNDQTSRIIIYSLFNNKVEVLRISSKLVHLLGSLSSYAIDIHDFNTLSLHNGPHTKFNINSRFRKMFTDKFVIKDDRVIEKRNDNKVTLSSDNPTLQIKDSKESSQVTKIDNEAVVNKFNVISEQINKIRLDLNKTFSREDVYRSNKILVDRIISQSRYLQNQYYFRNIPLVEFEDKPFITLNPQGDVIKFGISVSDIVVHDESIPAGNKTFSCIVNDVGSYFVTGYVSNPSTFLPAGSAEEIQLRSTPIGTYFDYKVNVITPIKFDNVMSISVVRVFVT